MKLSYHGGGCCGALHLFGFGSGLLGSMVCIERYLNQPLPEGVSNTYTPVRMEIAFKYFMDAINEDRSGQFDQGTTRKSGKLIEVILTDSQIRAGGKGLVKLLKDNDFKLVTRFLNSSGGNCNVFHKTTGKSAKPMPKWWTTSGNDKKVEK